MTALALKSGMRRGELAKLEVNDVHPDFLLVRTGKGKKDRLIPLSAVMAQLGDKCFIPKKFHVGSISARFVVIKNCCLDKVAKS